MNVREVFEATYDARRAQMKGSDPTKIWASPLAMQLLREELKRSADTTMTNDEIDKEQLLVGGAPISVEETWKGFRLEAN